MSALNTLPAATVVTSDDIFYVVDNPGGSPVDKKVTLAILQESLNLAKSNVFNATQAELPNTLYAQYALRNAHPVLGFDDTTEWYAIFRGRVPRTAVLSQGLTVYAQWAAASAVNGTIGWEISFEIIASAGIDIDADAFGAAKVITATTVAGTSGITLQTSVSFTQAELPAGLALGDMYRVKIGRDVANDNAAGNAQLLQLEVRWA